MELRSGTTTAVGIFGDEIGAINFAPVTTAAEPIVLALRFRATASIQYLCFKGRIYEIAITAGSVAVLI